MTEVFVFISRFVIDKRQIVEAATKSILCKRFFNAANHPVILAIRYWLVGAQIQQYYFMKDVWNGIKN